MSIDEEKKQDGHLKDAELHGYAERQISPAAFLRTHLHLENCLECRRRLDNMFPDLVQIDDARLIEDLSREVNRDFHLNYDDYLKPYVFGSIGEVEREIVESHAEICEACRGDLSDLLRFHRELEQEKEIRKLSAAGWFARLGDWIASTGKRSILIAAAAVLVVAAGIGIFVRLQPDTGVLNTAVPINNTEVPDEVDIKRPTDSVAQKTPESAPIDLASVVFPEYLKDLRRVDDSIRGNSNARSITVISPNGRAIRDRSPLLAWKTGAISEGFDVAVFDADLNRVAGVDGIESNSWRSPTLVPGKLYNWQVSARRGEGAERLIGQGRFYVVSNEALAKINAAKGGAERAKALAETGLLHEAAAEIRMLLKRDPNAAGARRLLTRIESAAKR